MGKKDEAAIFRVILKAATVVFVVALVLELIVD